MVFQFVSVFSKLLHYGEPCPNCEAFGHITQVASVLKKGQKQLPKSVGYRTFKKSTPCRLSQQFLPYLSSSP